MTSSRLRRVALLVAGLTLLPAGAAFAATGTSNRYDQAVVFFYGKSSGDNKSNDFSGGSNFRLDSDVPARTQTSYESNFKQVRRFKTDLTLNGFRTRRYAEARYLSGNIGTSSSGKYHVDAYWNYDASTGANASGYTKTAG